VLDTGSVAAGNELLLESRPFPRWTIDTVNRLSYADARSRRELRPARQELARCPALAASWLERLEDD
jgi:MOSC domain-containing protein YiiM